MPFSGRFPVRGAADLKPRTAPFLLLATLALLALTACGEEDPKEPNTATTAVVAKPDRKRSAERSPPRLACPAQVENCASARGRIIYVEAVDPDGDGDAHFALAEQPGLTLPGVTVIDVGLRLRPDPLPGPGDFLSAVGPVYTGSYGQRQIEATSIRFTPQRSPR